MVEVETDVVEVIVDEVVAVEGLRGGVVVVLNVVLAVVGVRDVVIVLLVEPEDKVVSGVAEASVDGAVVVVEVVEVDKGEVVVVEIEGIAAEVEAVGENVVVESVDGVEAAISSEVGKEVVE